VKTILVLDDMRNFPDDRAAMITTVRTSSDALNWFQLRGAFFPGIHLDELWLDFDLGGDDTAMPVVMYLAEMGFHGQPYPVDRIYLHTSNPVGRTAMQATLERYGYDVYPVEAHFGI
jgi:hypothetical protein